MTRKTNSKKINWPSIIGVVLIAVIIFGTIAAITSASNVETEKISSWEFSVGALDNNGVYKKTDDAIYTKEAFRCIGLRIEPDFELEGTYDVYYYDQDDKFLYSVTELANVYDEDYPLAYKCRIVIRPNTPDGMDEDDFKIHFYDVQNYASRLNITVNKEQKYLYADSVNLYKEDNVIENSGFVFDNSEGILTLNVIESVCHKLTEYIPVTYKNYDVFVRSNVDDVNWTGAIVVATESNKVIAYDQISMEKIDSDEWIKLTVTVKGDIEDDYRLLVKMPIESDCYIFGYND